MGGVLHWTPLTLLNNVSANRIFMLIAEANGATPQRRDLVDATSRARRVTPSDAGHAAREDIIYATGTPASSTSSTVGDNNLVYGLAVAWTFVDALKHAGKNPTRASFMKAMRKLNESGKNKNPFVYPGMAVKTSKTRTFPMEQLILEKWSGGRPTTGRRSAGVVNSGF